MIDVVARIALGWQFKNRDRYGLTKQSQHVEIRIRHNDDRVARQCTPATPLPRQFPIAPARQRLGVKSQKYSLLDMISRYLGGLLDRALDYGVYPAGKSRCVFFLAEHVHESPLVHWWWFLILDRIRIFVYTYLDFFSASVSVTSSLSTSKLIPWPIVPHFLGHCSVCRDLHLLLFRLGLQVRRRMESWRHHISRSFSRQGLWGISNCLGCVVDPKRICSRHRHIAICLSDHFLSNVSDISSCSLVPFICDYLAWSPRLSAGQTVFIPRLLISLVSLSSYSYPVADILALKA